MSWICLAKCYRYFDRLSLLWHLKSGPQIFHGFTVSWIHFAIYYHWFDRLSLLWHFHIFTISTNVRNFDRKHDVTILLLNINLLLQYGPAKYQKGKDRIRVQICQISDREELMIHATVYGRSFHHPLNTIRLFWLSAPYYSAQANKKDTIGKPWSWAFRIYPETRPQPQHGLARGLFPKVISKLWLGLEQRPLDLWRPTLAQR